MLQVWYSNQCSLTSDVKDKTKQNKFTSRVFFLVFFLASVALLFFWLNKPPQDFPKSKIITIDSGMKVNEIADRLEDNSVIRSSLLFKVYAKILYRDETFKAGNYLFPEPGYLSSIMEDIIDGEYQQELLRITHKEGQTTKELSELLGSTFHTFTQSDFFALAKEHEGKLFPETYLIPPDYAAAEVLEIFRKTYAEVMDEYSHAIDSHALSENEIIILASILEREANTEESMKMVSGILQNRLNIGMPLQADATIGYVLDKPLSKLTTADLEIESPYNTYLHRDLPPTPIGNPGRLAIEAVLYPTKSDYLYYITGKDGNFYYAESYEIHRRNIAEYLQ